MERIYSQAAQHAAARLKAWNEPHNEVSRLIHADYVAALKDCLSRKQVEKILARAQRLWPRINRVRHKVPGGERFARVAARQGVKLQASPYRGELGLALRGFYLDARELGARRPLIYLNTAHHPAIVALTWLHEMGHHLNRDLLKSTQDQMHFLIDAGYEDHLADSAELAADVIVVVGAFPMRDAARLALNPDDLERMARPGSLDTTDVERLFAYVNERIGDDGLSRAQRRRARDLYGPEAVHFTKLRCALMAAYGI
ncbi:MAG TPA: hypothetical protein VMA09_00285 [Candidatus Binataceae bacterium]|nr:hypothetical protein [Candidatus Binataceae bacterium]